MDLHWYIPSSKCYSLRRMWLSEWNCQRTQDSRPTVKGKGLLLTKMQMIHIQVRGKPNLRHQEFILVWRLFLPQMLDLLERSVEYTWSKTDQLAGKCAVLIFTRVSVLSSGVILLIHKSIIFLLFLFKHKISHKKAHMLRDFNQMSRAGPIPGVPSTKIKRWTSVVPRSLLCLSQLSASAPKVTTALTFNTTGEFFLLWSFI